MRLTLAHKSLDVPVMSDLELSRAGYSCGFEFETVIAVPGASREDLASAFQREFDQPIGAVCNVYAGHKHQGEADYTCWHFTRDGSIDPQQEDYEDLTDGSRFLPVEVVSPVVSILDSEKLLCRSFDLLKRVNGLTNDSCGLHFTFSSSSITRDDFNPLVFLLLTSCLDQRDLRHVNRLGNSYCFPTMSLFSYALARLKSFCGIASLGLDHILLPEAARGILRLTGLAAKHRHVSINLVKFQSHGVIEYRGIGGDYLNSVNPSYVYAIMKEYMTCAHLACDPVWIAANKDVLLSWLVALDTQLSFHDRPAYRRCLHGIPSDLDIGYIGNNKPLPGSGSLPDIDMPVAKFGDFWIGLNARNLSRNSFLRLNFYNKDIRFIGYINIRNDEYPGICVEDSRRAATPGFAELVGLVLFRLCRATALDVPKLLKLFFTRQHYHEYQRIWLPLALKSLKIFKVMVHRISVSPWSSSIRTLREFQSSRTTYRGNEDKRELLHTLSYSYGRVSGASIFDRLLDMDNLSQYSDVVDARQDLFGEVSRGFIPAVAVTVLTGASEEDTLSYLDKTVKSEYTQEIVELLSNHDADTVARHIASKLYESVTRFFEISDRKFIAPGIEMLGYFNDIWFDAVGFERPSLVYSTDDISHLYKVIAGAYLKTLKRRIDDVPSYVMSHSRYSSVSSRVIAFSTYFQIQFLQCFISAISANDNSWSHPSRLSFVYHILHVFDVQNCSMDTLKTCLNDRAIRKFNAFMAAPVCSICPDLY